MVYNAKLGLKVSNTTKKALKKIFASNEEEFWNHLGIN